MPNNPHTDIHSIEKYQFIYHFLPHPHKKTRATLLSHTAIFAYLLIILLFVGLLKFIPKAFPGVLGYASDITIAELFERANQERLEQGMQELRLNQTLSNAAEKKAQHMFKNDYWAHISPDGTDPWEFILGVGYDYVYAGENLAKNFNSSDEVIEAWYRSASHRDNLLSTKYDEMGFAVVDGVLDGYETTLVVQMFGRPRDSTMIASKEQEEQLLQQYESEEFVAVELETPEVLPAVDVSIATRVISLTLGGFLLVLLVLDIWYSKRKAIPKFTGHTLAHIIILLIALLGMWFILSPGRII